MTTRTPTILAALALGAAALPAAAGAKATAYHGKTRDGDPISFKISGSRISNLSAFVPTLCLPTEGLPLSGTDPFDPPGTFRVGRTTQVTAKRPNAIWDTSDVTKNFSVSAKRSRTGRVTGKLHVDYSFLQLVWTYPMSSRPYVCTGDTTFKLMPRR